MKLVIELGGTQTDTHCSMTSSINICGKFSAYGKSKCTMFHCELEYDWDAHAYKRCERCKEAEIKEGL